MSSSYNSISSFSTLPCLISDVGAGVRANNFNRGQETMIQQPNSSVAPPPKRRRSQPRNPSPEADVIALSPETIMATNRFICEVCNKGFQREQNLQLHRRGHNLPWKLKPNSNREGRRKVYICPEPSCVRHEPSHALGDFTGIKKHYYRKHGVKNLKCDKCSKSYAVETDLKAHSKTCGTKEYRCDCGTIFLRRDSYTSHRALCEAIRPEPARNPTVSFTSMEAADGGGGRHGFYCSGASALSQNHFGNSSNSGFAPIAASYNMKSDEFVPRSANPNSGGPANFLMQCYSNQGLRAHNNQGLMNPLAATIDHQSRSRSLFDPRFRNNLSTGGSERLNLDFLGVNGGMVSTISGRGGRNGAPLDSEMKFSHPNYPFGNYI